MLTRSQQIEALLELGRVEEALKYVIYRGTCGNPEKSVDPRRDYKECLNRLIKELTDARNEL